ncbi:hypothetical protein PV327_010682 [Microctonus hyperodae]|uniref:Elongator complex protein 4 n=1 Tax=Microctonus hyperodae TaxID=165561 RepID=A0AA39F0B6_MICHY|nr:hypothetical protein PV327_010682 [Microctonus hyperodae]
MATNIQKGTKVPYIPGTKPSIKNAQLLISTGITSLDSIIGGGLPIGSILVIEEDTYGNYAKIMLNYFLAEGIVSSHELFVASQDTQPSQLISELPAVIENPSSSSIPLMNDDKMQIAWRYQNMRVADLSNNEQTFGHYYDLTKKMDKDTIDKAKIIQWNGEKNIYFNDFKWNKYFNGFNNLLYIDLLKNIQESLKNENFYVNANPHKRNILRIGIHSLGSRLWLSDVQSDTDADFLKFFYCFRALLRSSYAVAVITVPVKNFETHSSVIGRMEHMADTAIALESFAGSPKETNPIFKDYHGLLHIKKMAAINTLAAFNPKTYDLAFKMRRKKFVIETLHLPPEFGETTQREQDDSPTGCGGAQSKLNF